MFEISTEGFKLIINNGNHRFKFAKYIWKLFGRRRQVMAFYNTWKKAYCIYFVYAMVEFSNIPWCVCICICLLWC